MTLTTTDIDSTALVTGASVQNGTLEVIGTQRGDTVVIDRNCKGQIAVTTSFLGCKARAFNPAGITDIEVLLLGGNDTCRIVVA